MRKNHPAFRMQRTEDIQEKLHFLDTGQNGVIAYTLGEYANDDLWKEILVVFNGNKMDKQIEIPKEEWIIVGKDGKIDEDGIGKTFGGKILVPGSSALILYHN